MRYAIVVLSGLVGIAVGWFGHALLAEKPQPRADASARRVVETPPLPAVETPVSLPPAPSLPVEGPAEPEQESDTPAQPDADEERLREMVTTQLPSWKAFARMQAGQKAEGLLAGLPFDAAREKRIQELLQQEAELQAERAAMMMIGEGEMDPAAFAWFMGVPGELTPRLEQELATFLNDGELQVLRAEVKRTHDKHMNDMADMQIGMMQIGDLSDDQKTRMREVFVGKDVMTQQFTRFGEIVRDRDRMKRLLRGEGLEQEMERQFEGTRGRMRDILNPDQYRKYEAYEKGLVRQAQMGLKMMSAFLGQPREGTKAPASK